MKNIIVVGFGGFGREVAWLAKDCGYNVLGFLDDEALVGEQGGQQILGAVDRWVDFPNAEFVVAIGSPRIRKMVVDKMLFSGTPAFATLIHPSVIMSGSVIVGSGSVICAGCVLTVDVEVLEHVIINLNVTVGHDCFIGSLVTIAPMVAISGSVNISSGVEVGTGASIRQGIQLGKGAMLGMGGVLTRDAEENYIYVGSPAKVLKKLPGLSGEI
ncbi:acetyltransferase [Zhongshania sp.]|jgi:sugar O-acyltransferase (sialic acid O-acetyltransferase NeuD family)|uniref:acetyltransferase n=1 Tax=Zhongshania sp. TaxID=1971902 RepID=UPI0039E4429F